MANSLVCDGALKMGKRSIEAKSVNISTRRNFGISEQSNAIFITSLSRDCGRYHATAVNNT